MRDVCDIEVADVRRVQTPVQTSSARQPRPRGSPHTDEEPLLLRSTWPPGNPEPDLGHRETSGCMARSFDEVFATEFDSLQAYLHRRVGASAAEDLTAETFATAYRRWNELEPARRVRPWLYGIATNLLRHHWRKQRRMWRAYSRTGVDLVELDDEGAVERLDARAQARALAQSLVGLRPAEREVLLLHAWAQLTDEEIAEALSLPVGTVKSRLSRARNHLRNHFFTTGQSEVGKPTTPKEIR